MGNGEIKSTFRSVLPFNELASGSSVLRSNSSCSSLMSIAKTSGYGGNNMIAPGKYAVSTKPIARKICDLGMFSRISTQIQKYILQPQNSWIEKLDVGETCDIGDINTHMDVFYIVRGEVEFLMREDPIHRARKAGSENDSIATESVYSHVSIGEDHESYDETKMNNAISINHMEKFGD